MENLKTREYLAEKPKWKIISGAVACSILVSLLAYSILAEISSDSPIKIFGLVHKSFFLLFALFYLRYVLKKHIIHLKNGDFFIASGMTQIFKFKVDDVEYVDRHFDEWKIYLKDGKKKTFSDAEIPKEQKQEFREIMNLFPKVHPHTQL